MSSENKLSTLNGSDVIHAAQWALEDLEPFYVPEKSMPTELTLEGKMSFEMFKDLILQAQKESPSTLTKEKIRQFSEISRNAVEIFMSEDTLTYNSTLA